MNPIQQVGVIGLGVIGKPIAERLLKAGYSVSVNDVRPEPVTALQAQGARACTCAREVAEHSDLILGLVSDAPQTADIVHGENGIVHGLRANAIFATGSTLGPQPVQDAARVLAAKGCATIDMPITGGYLAAAEGKLSLMLGGDEVVITRATPAFRAFASTLIRAGDIGAGQAAKLAHQLVMSINILGLLEGLTLGVQGGVAPGVLRDILKSGLANSTVLDVWRDMGPRWKGMLKPADPSAPLPNIRKDLHSALELAKTLELALPIGTLASALADRGKAVGHADPAL
jgi:2-hydroxy-3-oxopropionate reductase